ncbi:protein cordon-bleu isoform X3 [Sphaeramia orbicularis]|uniref:WH2 domain-containing protein n=1 Tax=Sphaeramia orbicularis TaxID=375764 RepID=A0A673CWA2_9TELE|nr:protein cordon-bleu isoform X3 [Sphaeramia orbicularis]
MTDSLKPPLGRRMKARAPPPPQAPQPAPRHIFRNTVPDGGGTSGMEAKENMLMQRVDLHLTLPQGFQTKVTEDGSKALMDLLVELCSRYHLNPALHTLELLTPEGHPLGFKPNVLLGSLNVACILIKEKVLEEKLVRRPAPKVPEKSVRLMVNYHSSQKAVVRVNPLLPLQALVPVICDKCELDPVHVLLLKDSISRHELPLDKSLTQLGIKELYVHDQSLVLQPKMASAPVLNYSDSIRSSTTSLGRAEKKGLLGIFQFSRRKSKTETTSMDMTDSDGKVFQNTDKHSNALSTASGVPSVEERPNTLGQSQSAMNISRMSPKAETKKRRAPAPPAALTSTMGNAGFESYQMGLGSESQQRKRKAPAPPPTPASTTPGPDDTSTSAAPTPDSHFIETPTPVSRTKVAQPATVSGTTVVTQTVKPAPLKTTVQPTVVYSDSPTPSSPTPSSSTSDSLAVQDSSSELSHSLDDSEGDPDGAGSHCSTLTSSTASGSVQAQPITKSSASSSKREKSERTSNMAANEVISTSSDRSDTESALNLKIDEVENNRHSAMGTSERPVPPKPRRSPAQELPQHVIPPSSPTPTPSPPPSEYAESDSLQKPRGVAEAAPKSWLHSSQSCAARSQNMETETAEEETVSLDSSGGSSLPDQGYAASEGMAEGEDSGLVSSPSDTQTTSPDGSLSLDGSSGGGGERLSGPAPDNSSDSDEGCATWDSRHRHNGVTTKTKSDKIKTSYEDKELSAELHKTLADLEADLADSNEVPVSVVDLDVPVTAIDEVLEEDTLWTKQNETESYSSQGPGLYRQISAELQNKNNNACTAAASNKSNTDNKKQRKSVEETSISDKTKDKNITDTTVKDVKKATASEAKSDDVTQMNIKNTQTKPDSEKRRTQHAQEKKSAVPPSSQRDGMTQRVHPNITGSTTLHGKITENVTSRFGMKTFTVVPPKPSVMHVAMGEPAVTVTPGAIKIDEQGNMVKMGISRNKLGGASESGSHCSEGSPLLGKAKAFWSSNVRPESVAPQSKGLSNKGKESTDGLNTCTTTVETTQKTTNTESMKTSQGTLNKPAEAKEPQELVKDSFKEPVKNAEVENKHRTEAESKISVSVNIQQPSHKPTVPPPLTDLKRDLSFLKPSRRTSSQYVASAITKHTPKTSAKPISSPNNPESSSLVKTQNIGLPRSGRSIQINPNQSFRSTLTNNENNSAFKSNHSGPKRSMTYPQSISGYQKDCGEATQEKGDLRNCAGSTKGSSKMLETETANNHEQSNGTPKINVTAKMDRNNTKQIQPRSLSPAPNSPVRSSAKPLTAVKTIHQDQPISSSDTTQAAATHQISDGKPEPSVTVSDCGVTPGPPPVTLFGPVKKFRPVICRSVERETSLHSSLMEAIQTGGGRERLKKISTSGSSNTKKPSYIEEENERSALMAAIRAQGNSGRLRKTKSEAADELESFRKTVLEESRSPRTATASSLTSTSPPACTPPPPPPAPMVAPPPPPPPALPQGKPNSVSHPSANPPMNPAMAREAMLEAIRSGSAAERLKKVAVPAKTVQVNGRLGTIQAASSTLSQ